MTETRVKVREAKPEPVSPPSHDDRVDRVFVIRPAPRWPHLDLAELWHYRELLLTFVWRDIKVRYKQSFLGFAWALLVPVFTATVYVVIFGKFAKFPNANIQYPILVFSGKNPIFEFEMGSLQEMDQVTIARSITKWAKTCFDTRHLADYTTAALRHALSGRPGPVRAPDYPEDSSGTGP